MGIGFSTSWSKNERDGLRLVFPPRPEWDSPLWLVTHVDLHRTAKVQTFVTHLKEFAKTWPAD